LISNASQTNDNTKFVTIVLLTANEELIGTTDEQKRENCLADCNLGPGPRFCLITSINAAIAEHLISIYNLITSTR